MAPKFDFNSVLVFLVFAFFGVVMAIGFLKAVGAW